jgi:serine/threonine/tyrosine-interacting protein
MVGLEVHHPRLYNKLSKFILCRFEYRRNMQEVLPNVFLGPLSVARVNSTLHANRITMMIPVRTPNTARFLVVPNDDNGQPWPSFPVDIQHDQIMSWFYKTYLRVTDEVEKGGRVFVYCENGNGLSAAICVALVMDTRLYTSI